jgi:RNA polymerase sigma-70 factor, ECF subfamily
MRLSGGADDTDDTDDAVAETQRVGAVTAGDEAAFLALVAEWSPRLQLAAARLCGDQRQARDLVRRTWIRALPAMRGFRSPPGLRALLLRSLLDEARASGVLEASAADYRQPLSGGTVPDARFLPENDAQWPGHWATPPAEWPALDQPPDGGRSPADLEDVVADAVARLPEPQRVVLVLRDCGGCPTEDVGRIIAVPEGQARSLLHRARAALHSALDEHLLPSTSA